MPLKTRELRSILLGKFGFYQCKKKKDHKWLCLEVEGLPVIMTQVSHGSGGVIFKGLESKIRRQLRVRKEFFDGMIQCPNSRDDYIEKLRTDPSPPWEHRF